MAGELTGAQINDVLRLVKSMTPNGDEQLSILARAFVIACKSCKASPSTALPFMRKLFDEDLNLIMLDSLE